MDRKYWDSYYNKHLNSNNQPSPFARFSLNYLTPKSVIADLGCGNARDSIFFFNYGFTLHSIDQSKTAIDKLRSQHKGINFIHSDIKDLDNSILEEINNIYCRFFLHAIDENEYSNLMKWITKCKPGTLFLSESRSIDDNLFGQGVKIAENTFTTDHSSHFIERKQLETDLIGKGFEILESIEDRGLAVYKDEDPMIIRIIGRKG